MFDEPGGESPMPQERSVVETVDWSNDFYELAASQAKAFAGFTENGAPRSLEGIRLTEGILGVGYLKSPSQ